MSTHTSDINSVIYLKAECGKRSFIASYRNKAREMASLRSLKWWTGRENKIKVGAFARSMKRRAHSEIPLPYAFSSVHLKRISGFVIQLILSLL